MQSERTRYLIRSRATTEFIVRRFNSIRGAGVARIQYDLKRRRGRTRFANAAGAARG